MIPDLSVFGFFSLIYPFVLSFSKHALHGLCQGNETIRIRDPVLAHKEVDGQTQRVHPALHAACAGCPEALSSAEEEILPTLIFIFPVKIYAGGAFFHY